ncbi:MAG: UDP-N-acetylmuramate dehydrogenase [Anaerolineae bacterium]|jgi:UDP-N-acetylmuramate dehydrogenase
MKQLESDLRASLGPDAVQRDEPLARYTALRIGGPADLLVVANSLPTLRQAVLLAWEHEVPCRLLGAGSNILVSDAGVRGLVVINRARAITFHETAAGYEASQPPFVEAESGASMSTLARLCIKRGLAGLEWAIGIPGTVGGAVVGNAGAWGGNVASTLEYATILQADGQVVEWPVQRFEYGYRTSLLKRLSIDYSRSCKDSHSVVCLARFILQQRDVAWLESRAAEITVQRKASQPKGATCGSVFKNPEGDHAGRLIEAAGLKGQRSGAAEISPIHANFVINHGGATAADIKTLIDLARERVWTQFQVGLELEIELLGKW